MATRARRLPRRLPLWNVGLLMAAFAAAAPGADAQEGAASTVQSTKTDAQANWLSAQIRLFRSYPHLHRAYQLLEEGKVDDAASSMKTYLELNPQDVDVRTAYINVLHRQDNTAELLRQVAYVLGRDPDNVKALIHHGLASQKNGDYKGLSSFKRVYWNRAASEEERILAASAAADMALARAHHMDALEALTVLLSLQESYLAHYRLGVTLQAIGNTDLAERAFLAASRHARKSEERIRAHSALGYLTQQKGDLEQAARHAEAILALDPANVEWMRNLVNIHYKRKELGLAETTARRLYNATHAVQDRIVLANVLFDLKNHAEAIEQYTAIARQSTDEEMLYRVHMGLGYAYQLAGKQDAAHEAFRRAASIQPAHEARAAAALTGRKAKVRVNQPERQPDLDELLAAYGKAPTAHDAATIGYLYANKEDHEKAAHYFNAALEMKDTPVWRLQLGQHYVALRQPEKALELLRPVSAETVPAPLRIEALKQTGYIHSHSGNLAAAAAAFEEALAAERDDPVTRKELGFIYAELKRYPEAIEQLLQVLGEQPAPKDLLAVGRIYAAMNEPGLALEYYKLAESNRRDLDKVTSAALYSEMGYLFAQSEQFESAQGSWNQAAALIDTPDVQLNLAYADEMRGKHQDALARLDAIAHDSLNEAQKRRLLGQYIRLYKKSGDDDNAARYMRQVVVLDPSAERHYELALHALRREQLDDARVHLHEAVRLAPDNDTYRLQLAYLFRQRNEIDAAIAAFEQAAARDPDRLGLQQDLAYAYAHAGDNEKSVAWFKKAIDTATRNLSLPGPDTGDGNDTPTPVQDGPAATEQIYALRQQIREMTRTYQLNAYQSYRSNWRQTRDALAPGFTTGALVPSQGGVEFLYQPAGIGYRDGRTLRFFGRTLWSNRPDSFQVASDTVQGGFGIEYKPFRDVNLYVAVERLVKIGDESENNWLVRASWGYSNGYDLKPNRRSWNHTIAYVDVGYFLQHDNIRSVYAELRQGWTYNIGNRLLLTPHLALVGRGQTPDPFDGSYFETGAGISMRYLFNESAYSAPRSSVELTVQYRKGATGNRQGGWLATAALRF